MSQGSPNLTRPGTSDSLSLTGPGRAVLCTLYSSWRRPGHQAASSQCGWKPALCSLSCSLTSIHLTFRGNILASLRRGHQFALQYLPSASILLSIFRDISIYRCIGQSLEMARWRASVASLPGSQPSHVSFSMWHSKKYGSEGGHYSRPQKH